MRMWHVDLLWCLPCKQLLAQWRECCCIAKNWADYGSPGHVLVNVVTKYPLIHYIWYCHAVLQEMWMRDYEVREISVNRINKNIDIIKENLEYFELYADVLNPIPEDVKIYPNWMNDRYLLQCYFNLEEKYDRGGVSPTEWEIFEEFVSSRLEHLL